MLHLAEGGSCEEEGPGEEERVLPGPEGGVEEEEEEEEEPSSGSGSLGGASLISWHRSLELASGQTIGQGGRLLT